MSEAWEHVAFYDGALAYHLAPKCQHCGKPRHKDNCIILEGEKHD